MIFVMYTKHHICLPYYKEKRRICPNIPEFNILLLKMEGVNGITFESKQKPCENETMVIITKGNFSAFSRFLICLVFVFTVNI